MIKVCIIFIAAWFLFNVNALAMGEEDYESACNNECSFLTKDCTAYVECRVARTTCTSNCMQRKVWEKVATAIDSLTAVLEKQAKEKETTVEVVQPPQPTTRVSYEKKAVPVTPAAANEKESSPAQEARPIVRVE